AVPPAVAKAQRAISAGARAADFRSCLLVAYRSLAMGIFSINLLRHCCWRRLARGLLAALRKTSALDPNVSRQFPACKQLVLFQFDFGQIGLVQEPGTQGTRSARGAGSPPGEWW